MLEHVDLVLEALKLAYKIGQSYQNVPKQRGRCRELIEQVSRLGRLLKELHDSRTPQTPPLTPQAKACFEGLNQCLEDAYRVLQKTSRTSILRYIFMSKEVDEEMSTVSANIDGFLKSLPLIQFTQATAVQKEVQELRRAFSKLSTELKHTSTYSQELASEVLSILRDRKADNEQESTLDKLLTWLAEKFESDIDTVRKEWEDMKKMQRDLMAEVDGASSSKRSMEDKLLEQIIFCLDELNLEDGRLLGRDPAGIPDEFLCSVCHGLMKNAIVLTSGQSYCKSCIEQCFRDGPAVCPYSRAVVQNDMIIPNFSVRNAITRWIQEGADASKEEAGRPVTIEVEERTFDEDFVLRTVSELQSDNNIKQLKALNCLLEVASSANGTVLIIQSEGLQQLAMLLASPKRMVVEKTAGILGLMTGRRTTAADETGVLNEVFEHCWDALVALVTTVTGTIRLKSAVAVSNLLLIPEAVEFLLSQQGIVSSFATVAAESEDGIEISLRCLRKLSRNKDARLTGDCSLVACLLDLLKSEEDCIVKESLLALRAVVSASESRACEVLRTKKAVPHIVHCAASSTGIFQQAAIHILEQFAKHEGFNDLVEAGFNRHIMQLISTLHGSEDTRVLAATVIRLSTACLDMQTHLDFQHRDLPTLISRLMDLLRAKDCTADVLQFLKTLCLKDRLCKELILDNDGITALLVHAASPRSTCRKGALGLFAALLESSSCQEEFCKAGGIEVLAKALETDENIECVTDAIVSFNHLASNDKLRHLALQNLEVHKLVLRIDDRFSEQCRDAAASLALSILYDQRSDVATSGVSLNLNHLLHILQQTTSSTRIRSKVAEILLWYASRGAEVPSLNAANRANVIELAAVAGETYKDLLLSFVSRCRPIMVEEVPLLLEAFARHKYRQDAAASIRMLVEDSSSSHSILLEAGYGKAGINALKSTDCEEACIDDISASLVLLFSGCKQSEDSTRYIEALLELLVKDSRYRVTRASVCMLASFTHTDCRARLGVQNILKRAAAISGLLSVLEETRLEALELLSIAVDDPFPRKEVYQQGGIPKLIECLSSDNDRVQELAIFVLLELGTNEAIQDIRANMISNGIMTPLLNILQKTSERSHAAVINSACLIRNLVRGSNQADHVLRILLTIYKNCLSNSRKEGYVERMAYVVSALEALIISSAQQLKPMLRDNAVFFTKPLEEDFSSRGDPDDKIQRSILMILTTLVHEGNKELRGMLLTRTHVSALRSIMERSANNDCKSRVVNLLIKVIQLTSPSSLKEVCKMLRDEGCISGVFRLVQVPECSRHANNLIELLRQDRTTRTYIEGNFVPWQRTTSAPR